VSTNSLRRFLSPTYACTVGVLAAMLVLVPRAAPASSPLLALGPITIANGTALVTGTLGPQVSGATLAVNGRPLAVDAAGNFAAVINLGGASALVLDITRPADLLSLRFRIPVPALGVIPGSVLDSLLSAGLTVLKPVGGGGQPVTVSGSVLNAAALISLSVNGVDALRMIQQGGSFHVQLPPSTETVSVSAGGQNGTSETVVQPVFKPFSVRTVSARDAVGLKIAKIRYIRTGVLRTHRLRMVVTVQDARGLFIQGATIRVQARGHRLANRPQIKRSGPAGRATFVLRLRSSAFGKRLFTTTLAKTPHAKARRTTSVRVPRRH
jgi:hypothetical protein